LLQKLIVLFPIDEIIYDYGVKDPRILTPVTILDMIVEEKPHRIRIPQNEELACLLPDSLDLLVKKKLKKSKN